MASFSSLSKSLCLFFCFCLLSACQPRDVNLNTAKQRLEKGEVISVTQNGKRLPTCPENSRDWDDLRISSSDVKGVVLGSIQVSVTHGTFNCLRVGRQVSVFYYQGQQKIVAAQAVITGLYLGREDKISSRAISKSINEDYFNKSLGYAREHLQAKDDHVVNVVWFRYVEGSSPQEASFKAGSGGGGSASGIEEAPLGHTLEGCGKKTWNDIEPSKEYLSAVQSGQVSNIIRFGAFNCLVPGSTADLKANFKDETALAKVKILKVKRLPVSLLTADMVADLLQFKKQSFNQFRGDLIASLKKYPRDGDVITITTVQVPGNKSPVAPISFENDDVSTIGAMLKVCNPKLPANGYVFVPGSDMQKIKGGQQTVIFSPDYECVRVGDRVQLDGLKQKQIFGSAVVSRVQLLHFADLNQAIADRAYVPSPVDLQNLLLSEYGSNTALSPWTVISIQGFEGVAQ